MPSVADCLRQHAPAYLETFADDVPSGHREVLGAITRCRTGELGGVLCQWRDCGREHWVGRSCGNRHCPNCQIDKTAKWLEKQTSRLLPVHHFLVTFKSHTAKPRTVPGERFVGGFAQHILPRGFQKIRYYGWMSSNSKVSLDEVQWLVWLYLGWTYWLASGYAPQPEPLPRQPVRCAGHRSPSGGLVGGGEMRVVSMTNTNCRVLIEHSVKYLDSG